MEMHQLKEKCVDTLHISALYIYITVKEREKYYISGRTRVPGSSDSTNVLMPLQFPLILNNLRVQIDGKRS